jgi:hypothetical protein
VSREADRWFVSLTVDTPASTALLPPQVAIGVDLGVKTLATLSNGEVIAGPKAHTALLKRLRRSNKAVIGHDDQMAEIEALLPGDAVCVQRSLEVEGKDGRLTSIVVVAEEVLPLRKRAVSRLPIAAGRSSVRAT